jgi:hypothetical protein
VANIVHASSVVRIAGKDGRSVCSITGVNPDMPPVDAAGFVDAIEVLYNSGAVTARISSMSNIVR